MPATPSFLQHRLEFAFPSDEADSGIPLSNGTFGALLWGEGRSIRLTINRSDYWSEGNSLSAGPEGSPEELTHWLAEGDEEKVRALFEGQAFVSDDLLPRSTPLPMGRLDLELPADWSLESGGLHLLTGEAELELESYKRPQFAGAQETRAKLRAALLRDTPVVCLRITGLGGSAVKVLSRPPDAPEVVDCYARHGLPRPHTFDLDEFGGWVQECPGEPALCVAWLRHSAHGGLLLYVTAVYGDDAADARRRALETLESANVEGYTRATLKSFSWWRKWWERAADVRLPDPTLELLYHLGMYRLRGLSTPGASAAPLPDVRVVRASVGAGSSDVRRDVRLRAGAGGQVAAWMDDEETPLIHLRPDWLDGEAIGGHRPRIPRWGYAVR